MADIIQTLVEMRSGAVAADCSQRLTEVLQAVMQTGKKGRLTIDIMIEPAKIALGEVKEVALKHVCKVVEPVQDPGVTIFFPLKDGNLSRQDPNQMALELTADERNQSVR